MPVNFMLDKGLLGEDWTSPLLNVGAKHWPAGLTLCLAGALVEQGGRADCPSSH